MAIEIGRKDQLVGALLALAISGLLAACSAYHGPITNAPEGDHQIGLPQGP